MEYKEASEICRNNPGSYFKRGPTGEFIVHLENGDTISSNNSQPNHQSPQKEHLATLPSHERSHITPNKEIEDQNNRIGDIERELGSQTKTINFLISLINSQKEIIDQILMHNCKIKSDLKKFRNQ